MLGSMWTPTILSYLIQFIITPSIWFLHSCDLLWNLVLNYSQGYNSEGPVITLTLDRWAIPTTCWFSQPPNSGKWEVFTNLKMALQGTDPLLYCKRYCYSFPLVFCHPIPFCSCVNFLWHNLQSSYASYTAQSPQVIGLIQSSYTLYTAQSPQVISLILTGAPFHPTPPQLLL